MSEYTTKTGLSSILKNYSPNDREKLKLATINKVRFELPKSRGLLYVVEDVLNNKNYVQYTEFLQYLYNGNIDEQDIMRLLTDAKKVIHSLNPETFPRLVETILCVNWINHNETVIEHFKEFVIDVLIAHNKYSNLIIKNLIKQWIPSENGKAEWNNFSPNKIYIKRMENIHDLLDRLLNVMPMLYNIIIDCIEKQFPYIKSSTYIINSYIYNCIWVLEYRPELLNFIVDLLIKNYLQLDVNAPRNEIEECEEKIDNLEYNTASEAMFEIEGCNNGADYTITMAHQIAESLDVALLKLLEFSKQIYDSSNDCIESKKKKINFKTLFNVLLDVFEKRILCSHNTHHVQFIIFYCCSFRSILTDKYLKLLWSKITNPDAAAIIRQTSVGYLASFLARSKFTPINVIRKYLSEICNWALQYIERSDSINCNISLKTNLVFYAMCQAAFYIIAFRSRDLTKDKQSLLFLQSLQLSALVTCSLNPLRVCLPAVATAFAGVTRTYQLAYCHTILEKNARRKLATIYANELISPDECLDTFFPFDPYLLKKSGKLITPIYLKYQANETEEMESDIIENSIKINSRKRGDSEMAGDDDIDDFITDKKLKGQLSKSQEKEALFTYGLSPGFHT